MGGEYAQMWMVATPTKPGWCRCLWWFFAPAKTASKRTKTLAKLPTWLDHQTRSAGERNVHLSVEHALGRSASTTFW